MDSVAPDTGIARDDQIGRSNEWEPEPRPVVSEDGLIAAQVQGMAQLFEIGLAIAGALGRVATGQAGPAEAKAFAGTDIALAFDRITKAMGQITLLSQETVKLRESRGIQARGNFRRERKGAVERAVRDVAANTPSAPRPDRLRISLRDLFMRYDDYDDYRAGTFEDVVVRICRDLGIEPDPEILRRVAEARTVDPEPPLPPPTAPPDWTMPPNPKVVVVERPYTVRTTAAGMRVWVPLDSPHLRKGEDGLPQAPP